MVDLHKSQNGFSLVEVLLLVLVLALIGFGGYYVYSSNKNSSHKTVAVATKTDTTKQPTTTNQQTQLSVYTLPNDGLTFSYNPKITNVAAQKPDTSNDLYIEYITVKTGLVNLKITAGISGIGGGPSCENDSSIGTCDVVGTLQSKFLGKPVTYRLIKAQQKTGSCGGDGANSCDARPLTTSYFLDTSEDPNVYGPCCGTIDTEAHNTGLKAKQTGSLLLSIEPDAQIQNADLLKNADILETIKIIESMHY